MRQIVYVGPHTVVSVPTHRLAEVEHGKPVEVADHVAEDLTAAGTSRIWLAVDAKGKPVRPAPLPVEAPAVDVIESTEA